MKCEVGLALTLFALAGTNTAQELGGGAKIAASLHWGDYDGDGRLDVLVLAPSGGGRLLQNVGLDGFVDVTVESSE